MLLSFGVAALLFLVTEELISEAHEGEGGQNTLVSTPHPLSTVLRCSRGHQGERVERAQHDATRNASLRTRVARDAHGLTGSNMHRQHVARITVRILACQT